MMIMRSFHCSRNSSVALRRRPNADPLSPSLNTILCDLFRTTGISGVYHTSVELSIPFHEGDTDPTPQEFAFGGHDSEGTGVFSVPAGSAAARMPGLRPYMTLDVGEAFGPDWEASRKKEAGSVGAAYGFLPSTSQLSLAGPAEFDTEDDGGASDGTQYLSTDERRAWRIIERMREEPQWQGRAYRLLGVRPLTSRLLGLL